MKILIALALSLVASLAQASREISLPPIFTNFDFAVNPAVSGEVISGITQTLDFNFKSVSTVPQKITVTVTGSTFACLVQAGNGVGSVLPPRADFVSTVVVPAKGVGGGVLTCSCLLQGGCAASLNTSTNPLLIPPWFDPNLTPSAGTPYSNGYSLIRAQITLSIEQNAGAILATVSTRMFGPPRDGVLLMTTPQVNYPVNGGRPF